MSRSSRLPPEIIEHWPEIFNDIEIKSVPIEYINSIHVFFHNGRLYTIDVRKEKIKYGSTEKLESSLEEFFSEYDEHIKSIDFSIDTPKVKHDIKKRTRSFMKKLK